MRCTAHLPSQSVVWSWLRLMRTRSSRHPTTHRQGWTLPLWRAANGVESRLVDPDRLHSLSWVAIVKNSVHFQPTVRWVYENWQNSSVFVFLKSSFKRIQVWALALINFQENFEEPRRMNKPMVNCCIFCTARLNTPWIYGDTNVESINVCFSCVIDIVWNMYCARPSRRWPKIGTNLRRATQKWRKTKSPFHLFAITDISVRRTTNFVPTWFFCAYCTDLRHFSMHTHQKKLHFRVVSKVKRFSNFYFL